MFCKVDADQHMQIKFGLIIDQVLSQPSPYIFDIFVCRKVQMNSHRRPALNNLTIQQTSNEIAERD